VTCGVCCGNGCRLQHVPGWVVGKNVYFGQDRERPPVNHQDPRRISQW
jgi:hypothetical protein